MLKNAPTLAIVAVDTAENEPLKISLFHFISSILSLIAEWTTRMTELSADAVVPTTETAQTAPKESGTERLVERIRTVRRANH